MGSHKKSITVLPYLYRDASNYKSHGVIYLDGVLSPVDVEMIESKCDDGDGFIPHDLELGIEELQDRLTSFPSDDDHVFHEFDFHGMTRTSALPEGCVAIAVDSFLQCFSKMKDSSDWKVDEAELRLGLSREFERDVYE